MTESEAKKYLKDKFLDAYETALQDIQAGSNNSDIPYRHEIPLSPELIQVLSGTQAR